MTQHLKLYCCEPLKNFAFDVNSRRYAEGMPAGAVFVTLARPLPSDKFRCVGYGLTDDSRDVILHIVDPRFYDACHAMRFRLTQVTRVYNGENDVAGIICQALAMGCAGFGLAGGAWMPSCT